MRFTASIGTLALTVGLTAGIAQAQEEVGTNADSPPPAQADDSPPVETNDSPPVQADDSPAAEANDSPPAVADAPASEETENVESDEVESSQNRSGAYPQAFIDRPLTLPKGMAQLSVAVVHQRVDIGALQANATGSSLAAAYGITDKMQIFAATDFEIDPDQEWLKHIAIDGRVSLLDTAKLDIVGSLGLIVDFDEEADNLLPRIQVDAATRYLVDNKLFVLVGQDLLDINTDPFQLNINAVLGVGYQASPALSILASTLPLSIGIGDNAETQTYGDAIPVGLEFLYAIGNMIDLRCGISIPSLEDAGDFYSVVGVVNFRI